MQINHRKALGLVTGVALLAACSTQQPSYRGLSASENGQSLTTVVRYLSACPSRYAMSEMALPPIVSARGGTARSAPVLAGIAGDFVANLVSAELQAAKTGRDGNFTALGVFNKHERLSVNSQLRVTNSGCLVIYRGVSGSLTEERVANLQEGLSSSILRILRLADQPAFYLELDVEEFGKNRQLSVVHLQYAATSARFNGTGHKNVVVAIGFAVAAKKPEDPQSGSEIYRLNLGRLEIGRTYGPELAATSASNITSSKPPFNVVAFVNETDQPDVALMALAEAFESNKADVAGAVTDAVTGQ